jgi:transcriptional regulator with XRE-family HTH domain
MERSPQRMDAEARLRDFGRWLRLLRQSRHLSQEQLGDRAGIDRAVIGRIERGEVNVGIAYLWQLADALEIRVQDLLPADDHPLLKRDS